MRFLILFMLIVFVGSCTDSKTPSVYQPTPTPTFSEEAVPVQMVETQEEGIPLQDTTYYHLSSGINPTGVNCKEREYEPCGVTFTDCEDKIVRACMTNVTYEVKEK